MRVLKSLEKMVYSVREGKKSRETRSLARVRVALGLQKEQVGVR